MGEYKQTTMNLYPHVCATCDKGHTTSQGLREHMKTHGLTECLLCGEFDSPEATKACLEGHPSAHKRLGLNDNRHEAGMAIRMRRRKRNT